MHFSYTGEPPGGITSPSDEWSLTPTDGHKDTYAQPDVSPAGPQETVIPMFLLVATGPKRKPRQTHELIGTQPALGRAGIILGASCETCSVRVSTCMNWPETES
jgi:hypothetical protein